MPVLDNYRLAVVVPELPPRANTVDLPSVRGAWVCPTTPMVSHCSNLAKPFVLAPFRSQWLTMNVYLFFFSTT